MKLRMTITLTEADRAILEKWLTIYKVKYSNSISRCIQKEWLRQQNGQVSPEVRAKQFEGVDEVQSGETIIQ